MSNIVDAYLIFGQSNADGRQATPVNPLAEVDGTLTGLRLYGNTSGIFGNWRIGANNGSFTIGSSEWDPMGYALKKYRDWLGSAELHCIKATRGGVGLNPTFSSTGSIYWDTSQVTGTEKVYDFLKTRIEGAREVLASEGKYLRIKACLFHQGESDENAPYNSLYEGRLTTLIQKVRQLAWNPTMPWIMGTVPTDSASYDAIVRAAQFAVAAADPNVYCIDTGSGPLFDSYHGSSVWKIAFGEAMFEILKII